MAVPRKPHTVIPYVSTAIDCTHRIYSTIEIGMTGNNLSRMSFDQKASIFI